MGVRRLLRNRVDSLLLRLGYVIRRTKGGQVPTDLERTLDALEGCGLRPAACIDVGAHRGGWTRAALKRWPDMACVLMEPQVELLADAEDLLEGSDRISVLGVGAGPRDERAPFYHHGRADSSTFRGRSERTVGVSEVEVRRIDGVVAELLGGNVPDIVKLDCEGWDLEVLDGLGDLLGRVPVIFLEVGVANRGFENTVERALARLSESGYRLFDVGDAARNANGALWNAELCFVLDKGPIAVAASNWRGA